MGQAELLIAGVLVAVAGLSALARRLTIPYPIVLVIGGALFGFVPGMPEVKLNPQVVLVIFLPPLLYASAFFANLSDLRANLRGITLSSVGLVLATMAIVAVGRTSSSPGFPGRPRSRWVRSCRPRTRLPGRRSCAGSACLGGS